MPGNGTNNKPGYAYNRTRQAFLASELRVADSHWTRLMGLMGTNRESFPDGHGLWIVPCHGVHTMAMRYPIDVVYLDPENVVVHVEENVKPWRMTPVNMEAATVLEVPPHTVWNTGTKVGDQIEIIRERSHQAVA
ncbi:MAG: DUF192 domain-containing protein [Terriglobales bacterium]